MVDEDEAALSAGCFCETESLLEDVREEGRLRRGLLLARVLVEDERGDETLLRVFVLGEDDL